MSAFRGRTSPQLAFLSRALVGDWLVIVALHFLAQYIEQSYPYERDVKHQLADPTISWPHSEHERVPIWMLYQLAFWLPMAVLRQSSPALHSSHPSMTADPLAALARQSQSASSSGAAYTTRTTPSSPSSPRAQSCASRSNR